MAVPARRYNPGFLTDDDLVASFCVRTTEFELLVEALRECTGSSNPHQIVIGPRGSGKTSLLLRVAAEVRRDPALAAAFFPVVFAEESYEVATTGEFWLECLSQLEARAPGNEGDADLHRTVEELRRLRDDRTLAERCLAALLDFGDRRDVRLLLVVENLNMLFRDMADPDAGWRLRKTLQTEPRIIVFGSATSRFDEIDHPDHALYDLFRVRTLRPLDTSQCTVLWESASGRRPVRETIRALEILTGGSPRLISIVSRFGAGLSFRELMTDLFDLVDEHTEYFKGHIESLPAQERRVYLALATLWKPATTREIADQARLATSTCSAQLARLGERGVVQVAGGSARRKQYYLTERLYNIYYLLRRRHGASRLVKALVHFMEALYSPLELKDIGVRMVHDMESLNAETSFTQRAALERLIELPAMAGHRDELLVMMSQGTTGEPNAAAAREFFETTVAPKEPKRAEDALAACDEMVRRFGGSEDLGVLRWVAMALYRKGAALGQLDRPNEAIALCDDVIRRFGAVETRVFQYLVAKVLINKAATLHRLRGPEEALKACDEVVHRFVANGARAVLEVVGNALIMRAVLLDDLNRPDDALAAYDAVAQCFGAGATAPFPGILAKALVNKGALLIRLNRFEAGLAVGEEVVRRFGASDTPALQEQVAKALINRGAAFARLEQQDDVIGTCDEAIGRFGKSREPALVEAVARALGNKGFALDRMGRPEDALAVYRERVRRLKEKDVAGSGELVETALLDQAEMEFKCRVFTAAVTTVGGLLERGVESAKHRWRAHLIRARAMLAEGDRSGCERDLESVLRLLPELGSLPAEIIEALMDFTLELGPARVRQMIAESPSEALLLPLMTVVEEDLGLEPRVAREVEEVAADIRRNLAKRRGSDARSAAGEAETARM